jgi:hypothetical protein
VQAVFVDTNYLVAVLNKRDHLHQKAIQLSTRIQGRRLVSTDFVLIELLRVFARFGAEGRTMASTMVGRMRSNPNCEVVPATRDLLDRARRLYAERPDKQWDLVDCTSCLVMKDRELSEALTADQHFRQMGYVALL